MRIRHLLPTPQPHGYLGPATLIAFLSVFGLGVVFYVVGLIAPDRTMKGVGGLFLFIGIVSTVGLLIRWAILRRVT